MSTLDDPDLPFTVHGSDGPRLQAPPRTVVRIAGVAIILLAGVGLARGIIASRPAGQDASPLAVLTGNATAAANAKPATLLPRDDSWSTLSGPQMVDASAKPKAEAKPAASDDEDDSGSPAAQTAAADAIAPDAPDAAPSAPAAASNAQSAPQPQPAQSEPPGN
jgi:hypothetical protein